jgi:hypothetical protein
LQKKKPTFMQLLTANGWFSGLLYWRYCKIILNYSYFNIYNLRM